MMMMAPVIEGQERVHPAAGNEIVGRVPELSAVDRLVADVVDGRGNLIWVQGEPGIGKTALVNAALARASARGCHVLRGGGDELMEPFPLRLMADCLGITGRSPDPAAAQIASLLRGESGGAADPVVAAAERMLEMVDRLCADGPVVLAVEDLQWADEPSLLVLSRVARAVRQMPLLLIGATRPIPSRVKLDLLHDLAMQLGGVVLDLGPLDPDSASALGGRVVGGTPGPRLRAAFARASGNPLYVRELAESVVREGLAAVRGGVAELHGDVQAMPSSLAVAIGGRLGFLPPPARKALAVAALLGNEFDAADWAVAADLPMTAVVDLVELAVAAGVLTDAADRLRFRHELIHQALVEQTPTAMRSAMHAEIGRLLARAGRGTDAVARHLLAVPGNIDAWALDWLVQLPEAALYALPHASAELLTRAVESAEYPRGAAAGDAADAADPAMGADLRWEALASRLALVLFWLGRDEQAGQVALTVARRASVPVTAARMRVLIIRTAGRTGRLGDGLEAARPLPSDDQLPAHWRAILDAWSANLASAEGQAVLGATLAANALDQATASGDPLSIGYARHVLASCGGPSTRLAHINAGLDALVGQDPESIDLRMLMLAGQVTELTYLARQEETARALKEALTLAERVGGFRAATIQIVAAQHSYVHGRWDEALAHLANVEDEFTDAEPFVSQHGFAAHIALRRGDRPTADAHLRRAIDVVKADLPTRVPTIFPLTQALAMRAEADGNLTEAVWFMSQWLAAPVGLRAPERHDDLPYLIRLALAAGDTVTASWAAATALDDLTVDGSPSRAATARFCQALVADDAAGLLAVADDYRAHGWVSKYSFAMEEAAVRLAAAGQTARARAALTDAVRGLAVMGASWDIRRADARLRAYGVRRGPRSAHRRAATGWESLTPSEQRIADLVAEGLSNPDIAVKLYLSRRTVETHVSNILAKLQVNSRAGIVRATAEMAGGGAVRSVSA
jgi:DNA-binding NarL/FixJ family response regulator